jgi:hypothetical protein
MSKYPYFRIVLKQFVTPLWQAAAIGLLAMTLTIGVRSPAEAAADPIVGQSPAPQPAEAIAPVQGSINLMTIRDDWPKRPYPVPIHPYPKYAPYEREAYRYPLRPDDRRGPGYPEPRPDYAGPPPYAKALAGGERYEGRPGYAGPGFPGPIPPANGPDGGRPGFAGGPPGRPEPELPLAPDFELNKHRGFGRLFPILDPAYPGSRGLPAQPSSLSELRALGEALRERGDPEDPRGSSDMPAGYTFLGQFIDHDLTLDLSTSYGKPLESDQVANARTPELDLDNVYGAGPIGSPYLYKLPYLRTGRLLDGAGAYFRHDLLRVEPRDAPGPLGGSATAVIGDPRDDENLIVNQLHAAVVSFHNRTVDVLVSRKFGRHRYQYCGSNVCSIYLLADALPAPAKNEIFEEARDHVLHYYHRMIAEDLLPWLVGYQRTADLLSRGRDFYFPHGFRNKDGSLRYPYIPIEFAVAAFRYGHSQVGAYYWLHANYRVSLFRGPGGGPALQAFEPLSPRHLIDWRYFFEINEVPPPGFNWARRIDPLVTPALFNLNLTNVVGAAELGSLPARNLQRGRIYYLPSGQAIASQILPVLEARGVLPGGYDGGRGPGYRPRWQDFLLPPNDRTRYFLGDVDTPLWYYVLQEAEAFGVSRGVAYTPAYAGPFPNRPPLEPVAYGPRRGYREGGNSLGPVGGTIVGEVLVGLMEHFREKTGKGLAYEPEVHGSVSAYHGSEGYGRRGKPRYRMRNFLIDAGVIEPY